MLYFNVFEYKYIYYCLFLIGLRLKIGFFPGHFWVPGIIGSVRIIRLFLLLGPIKFAPLAFFNLRFFLVPDIQYIILILAVISSILGAIIGNNQTNVLSILGSSSVSHSGWILVAICYNWLWVYFFSYLIIIIYFCSSMFYLDYFSIILNILSIRGVPPFLIFIIKIKVLIILSFSFEYIIFLILIISSVFSLVFYMKFFFNFLITVKKIQKVTIIIFLIINVCGVFIIIFFES